MKNILKISLFLLIFINSSLYSQVTTDANNYIFAQFFSKEIALFNAKSFLFKNVLGSSNEVVKFEIIPLASAVSGELTTLIYNCESKGKEGLILGFYGDYWNKAGVIYKGFGFRNLSLEQAINFLNKIQNAINENSKYLSEDADNNNIYFKYEDIDILISGSPGVLKIRLFWNDFDSTWEISAFERSKKRFEKRTK